MAYRHFTDSLKGDSRGIEFSRKYILVTLANFRATIGHVMQMVGNSSAQDFKDSSSVGTGETHVFNTEDVLLSNKRLERSSPVP